MVINQLRRYGFTVTPYESKFTNRQVSVQLYKLEFGTEYIGKGYTEHHLKKFLMVYEIGVLTAPTLEN